MKSSCQRAVQGIRNRCSLLVRFHTLFLSALMIGTAIGVGSYYASPWFSAVVSGIGGFATALLIKVGIWLRRVFENSGNWEKAT